MSKREDLLNTITAGFGGYFIGSSKEIVAYNSKFKRIYFFDFTETENDIIGINKMFSPGVHYKDYVKKETEDYVYVKTDDFFKIMRNAFK